MGVESLAEHVRHGEAALPSVHAYRDNGPMLGGRTRWKPRRAHCTGSSQHADLPGREFVVKFRQGRAGAAALISEVVCHAMLEGAGFSVLDAAIVEVSSAFAAQWAAQGAVPYPVAPGSHFGTVFRSEAHPGPPLALDDLACPQELVDIWVFDSLVMNHDRNVWGNILMLPSGKRWSLVPADHSDCFGGAGCFATGEYAEAMVGRGAADGVDTLLSAIWAGGGSKSVKAAADKAREAAAYLERGCARVPGTWWAEAGVEPQRLSACLVERLSRIEEIVDVPSWGDHDGHGAIALW
jgi:hypothetical protein